ncbi:sigma-E processing peptidase SpoIIGA [Terrisporobacter petrolearius]|uniref:sigma-E processing peptidase SpoIIGA n=1 Tax=Terrisporobacter petrolearius TaxID=1460447 RepID=UPI001D165669|nr:sigma-E processing peptidase SpoIIGA [Terrisporobacter petrolearius]MCC3864522.1 sigma-E processing peptidase SpoIIGA [Terrisporobacter petrolearius]
MYLDIYIIENLLINYIIISCTSILTKNTNSYKRKIIGAIVGAIYSVIYLLPRFYLLYILPSKAVFIVIIGLISFVYTDKNEFLRVFTIFFLVNFFICGSTYFIIYFTGIEHIKISFVIASVYISCLILKKIYSDITLINHIKEFTKEVTISLLGEELKCIALLDSGNLLKDPLSKSDVIMVNSSLLEKYLPEDYNYEYVDVFLAEEIINNLSEDISSRIRLIPYNHATSNKTSMILGFKADYLRIDNKKIGNIVLGISNFKDDNYNAILNPSILS